MKFTENKINAIIEAYNQHLAVEFYYDNDYTKYRVEPSMFSILRKDNNYTYTKIISYNIVQIIKGNMNGKPALTVCCNSGGIDAGEIYFTFTTKQK